MADAPTPAVWPILIRLHHEYINLVEQLNRNIQDVVQNVKSVRSTLQSLDLSTQDLEKRYSDLRTAYQLHISQPRQFAVDSKSQITFVRLSPMHHLAAIHEKSENLQQEFDRCKVKCFECQQRSALPMFCVPALRPPLSASGDDVEGYIKSFQHLSDSLQHTYPRIQCFFQFMINNLDRTSCDAKRLAQDCKDLKALISSPCLRCACCAFAKCKKKVNIKARIQTKMLQLKRLLESIKPELADAINSIEFLEKVAEKLIKLQEHHHVHSQKLAQRKLFSQDHLAAIIQMRHDLDVINNL